jgi:hypothetical protein
MTGSRALELSEAYKTIRRLARGYVRAGMSFDSGDLANLAVLRVLDAAQTRGHYQALLKDPANPEFWRVMRTVI